MPSLLLENTFELSDSLHSLNVPVGVFTTTLAVLTATSLLLSFNCHQHIVHFCVDALAFSDDLLYFFGELLILLHDIKFNFLDLIWQCLCN